MAESLELYKLAFFTGLSGHFEKEAGLKELALLATLAGGGLFGGNQAAKVISDSGIPERLGFQNTLSVSKPTLDEWRSSSKDVIDRLGPAASTLGGEEYNKNIAAMNSGNLDQGEFQDALIANKQLKADALAGAMRRLKENDYQLAPEPEEEK